MKSFVIAVMLNVSGYALEFCAAQRAAAKRVAKLNASYVKKKSRIRDEEQRDIGEAFRKFTERQIALLESTP